MKPLLFQLTMSLNMYPQPVPNNKNWLGNPQFSNIAQKLLKALNLVLKLSFIISSHSLTDSNIKNLQLLGKCAVKHMNTLEILKTNLLNYCAAKGKQKEFIPFRGIKFHLLEHLFSMLPYYGVCGRAYDTQVSESSHKLTVKKLLKQQVSDTTRHYLKWVYVGRSFEERRLSKIKLTQ